MVKWRIRRYWGRKDSEKIGNTEIRSRRTKWQWVGDDICVCSQQSSVVTVLKTELEKHTEFFSVHFDVDSWCGQWILRNAIRNQRLSALFPGSRTALQTLLLQQEQMARTTTTDLTAFLGSTSRGAKQSASLLECILISDHDDTSKANFFISHCVSFHSEIDLALHKLVVFWMKSEYIGGPEAS